MTSECKFLAKSIVCLIPTFCIIRHFIEYLKCSGYVWNKTNTVCTLSINSKEYRTVPGCVEQNLEKKISKKIGKEYSLRYLFCVLTLETVAHSGCAHSARCSRNRLRMILPPCFLEHTEGGYRLSGSGLDQFGFMFSYLTCSRRVFSYLTWSPFSILLNAYAFPELYTLPVTYRLNAKDFRKVCFPMSHCGV